MNTLRRTIPIASAARKNFSSRYKLYKPEPFSNNMVLYGLIGANVGVYGT